jgi:RHS repeat-associated protein
MEKVTRGGVTEYRYQIGGPTGTVAIYTRRTDGSTPTYYLLRDHLGSPELITNTAGVPTVKLSFSAYGERRGSNWSGTPSGGEWNAIAFTTRDGFTEHEHLDNVGLVHMNGRVYDPRIGRFLSKDPIVHMGLSQSPNSYSYVWNNPLRWVDPSGASPETLQIPQLTQDGGHGGVIPGSTFVGGERTTATLSGVIVTATSLANSGRPPGVIPSVGVALNRGPPTRHGGGGRGTRSGSGNDTSSGVTGQCDQPGPAESAPVIVASPARTQCLEDCRRSLEPAVQGAAGAAGGFAGGFAAGAPMPGLGQLSAATIGAFAGGMTGFVTGVMAQSSASQPTRISLGVAAGAVTGGNVFLLQGGVGGARAVATMGLAGMLGAAAPASAGGVAGAAATATALSSVAAGVVAVVGAGTWFGYRIADAMADGVCGLKCGD